MGMELERLWAICVLTWPDLVASSAALAGCDIPGSIGQAYWSMRIFIRICLVRSHLSLDRTNHMVAEITLQSFYIVCL